MRGPRASSSTRTKTWDPYRLLAALNAHLPPDVRVMRSVPAPEGFFPRHHAVAKRYVYSLQEGPAEDPFSRGRRWHVHGAEPLDQAAMLKAIPCLIGEHDFSSFRHQECAAKSPIRNLHAIRLETPGPRLDLVFEGNRFLMHQVRIMAGTLVEVGQRADRPRRHARHPGRPGPQSRGPHGPALGLYLDEVWYQAEWGLGEPCPWG